MTQRLKKVLVFATAVGVMHVTLIATSIILIPKAVALRDDTRRLMRTSRSDKNRTVTTCRLLRHDPMQLFVVILIGLVISGHCFLYLITVLSVSSSSQRRKKETDE